MSPSQLPLNRLGRYGEQNCHYLLTFLFRGSSMSEGRRFYLFNFIFSDASQTAYAWVVYIRAVYSDMATSVSLVISKTKATPLKQSTIPRLELCVAHLLSKLIDHLTSSLQIDSASIYDWSDSSIALGWLNTLPHHLRCLLLTE